MAGRRVQRKTIRQVEYRGDELARRFWWGVAVGAAAMLALIGAVAALAGS